MVVSIFDEVMHIKDKPASELFPRLEEIIPDVFTNLADYEGGSTYGKYALMYIINAYSKESPFIVLGEQSIDTKKRIFEMLELPPKMYNDVVMLKSHLVREAILAYLDRQADRRWRSLMRNRDLYEAMSDHAVERMRKENDDIDFKGMVEAAKFREDLLSKIEEAEAEFREEYKFVFNNRDEIEKIHKASKGQSLSVENSTTVNERSHTKHTQ